MKKTPPSHKQIFFGIKLSANTIGWTVLKQEENIISGEHQFNFKDIRQHILGVNQEDIAKILGISSRTIRRYEFGEHPNSVTTEKITNIAKTVVNMTEATVDVIIKSNAKDVVLLAYNDKDFKLHKPLDFKILKSSKIHRHVLTNVAQFVKTKHNVNCCIVEFDAEDYFYHLGDKKDDEQKRAEWAAKTLSINN